VKSTLSARAPRQGLVFDGTAGATVANVPAFGTADYSIAAWLVWSGSSPQTIVDGSSSVAFFVNGSGAVALYDRISSSTKAITANGVVTAGKPCFVTYTRAGQIYVNGLASGAVVADTSNYTGTIGSVGQNYDGSQRFSGFLAVNIYNRSLSASEVVALYEAGAPAGADYQSSTTPAGVNLLTAAQATFTADTYWSKVNTTVDTGTGTATLNATVGGASLTKANSMVVGKRYRVTMEVSSANTTYYVLGNGTLASFTGTGTKTAEFVADSVTLTGCYLNSGTGTVVLDSLQVTPLGLLLAPDAAQAGGGLTWYDTSGNAANITLPASGVSWNVPTAGRGIFAAGTNAAPSISFANDPDTGFYNPAGNEIGISVAGVKVGILAKSASDLRFYGGSVLNYLSLGAVGDISLVAAGTNQNITLTPSGTGNVVADAGFILNRINAKGIYTGTSDNCGFTWTGTNGEFSTASGSLILKSAGTTALTLDSSQNATFAGKVYVGSTKFEFVHNGSQGDIQTYSSTPLYINRQGNIINFGAATLSMDPASGNMTMNGGLMTGAPSGGTANRWKFGSRVAATTTLDTTQYLQVDIGGTLYKVALVTS
jgi:hypothetical protein